MDPDPLSIIVLFGAGLVVLFGTAMETAIANLNRGDLRARSAQGERRATRLEHVIRDSDTALGALMLVKTLGYIVFGAAALSMLRSTSNLWLMIGVMLALWLLLMVAQALLRAFVVTRSLDVALRFTRTMTGITYLLRPISGVLNALGQVTNEGDRATEESVFLSDDGLRLLMHVREQEDELQDAEREMMASILDLEETIAREAMVPRIDMVALNVETDFDTALAVINEAGHSRIPVYEGNIDRVLGFLYAKDLLKCFQEGKTGQPIRALLRPAYFVPVTKKLNALFSEMQKQRIHVALVVDEYGGTAGLITIEDILEEIVGDIEDEYDAYEDEYVQPLGTQGYLLNARIDVDTLAELLDIELPDENADTLGGMLYGLLGRVPQQGDSVTYGGWRFSVILLDGRRIEQVRVEPVEPTAFSDDDVELSEQPSSQRSLPRFLSL